MDFDNQDIDLKEINIHPSWFHYISQFFFAFVFFAVTIVMYIKEVNLWPYVAGSFGIIILLRILLQRISFTYNITKDCVRSRKGLIARDESEIRITDIREVRVFQSIGQRIFGIGNIYFASAGTGGVEVSFEGVGNPHEIKDCVNEVRSSPGILNKKRCPQCGEFIWIKAKVCPHCNYKFEGEGG